MHTPQEIMTVIRHSLDNLCTDDGAASKKHRTKAIKALLCEIGHQQFGCLVCAADVSNADRGEWLYDVVWRRHDTCGRLTAVPLVAECEWLHPREIEKDFEKLLVARASVRLMIYRGKYEGSRVTAERLTSHVEAFSAPNVEEGWLLAAWKRVDVNPWFKFKYFTIRPDGTVDNFR